TSNFDVRHRVSLSATIPLRLWKDLRSSASFYYDGQSGAPYSQVFNGDANGDGTTTNDLVFVPASAADVVVQSGTGDQLDAYINNDPAMKNVRGQILPRNAGRAPWNNYLNFRYAVNIPAGGKTKVDVTWDIENLLNLFNNEKGWVSYANFGGPTLLQYRGIDAATGREIISLATITGQTFTGTFT